MSRRIGIYSGTFDPVHSGHLGFCRESIIACALDEIILLPEPSPRNKPLASPLDQRLLLLEEAIKDDSNISILAVSSKRFTIKETFTELLVRFPDSTFTFLAGSDVVKSLHQWENLADLLQHVSFAVGMREGDAETVLNILFDDLSTTHQYPINRTFVYTPHAAVSSTKIRQHAR